MASPQRTLLMFMAGTMDNLLLMPRNELVHAARLHMGLSQAALADLLGVRENTVWRWELPPDRGQHRKMPETAARLLVWMCQSGRPAVWPDVSK